ncbi:carbohydrate-binding domain-containing protein [Paenibacillus xylaniclasticus]|uniref:carbohydrate-binding domain-containing protein n=1 Tax=Paenibacillus xylaniclasticus TaxID=588083 RepID=UPI000FDC11D9
MHLYGRRNLNITAVNNAIRANRFVQIDGGVINIESCEEGIEATAIKINDVTGGTLNIVASSAFDSDGTAQLIGGDVTVNGEKITEITQSHPGGRGKRA